MQAGRVRVEVVCAAGGIGFAKSMLVPASQTLEWCVNASGLYAMHPHVRGQKLGVWGKVMPPESVVQPDDRIEVYLPVDPRATAKARALRPKVRSTGSKGQVTEGE